MFQSLRFRTVFSLALLMALGGLFLAILNYFKLQQDFETTQGQALVRFEETFFNNLGLASVELSQLSETIQDQTNLAGYLQNPSALRGWLETTANSHLQRYAEVIRIGLISKEGQGWLKHKTTGLESPKSSPALDLARQNKANQMSLEQQGDELVLRWVSPVGNGAEGFLIIDISLEILAQHTASFMPTQYALGIGEPGHARFFAAAGDQLQPALSSLSPANEQNLSGEGYWLLARQRTLTNPEGKTLGVLVSAADISEGMREVRQQLWIQVSLIVVAISLVVLLIDWALRRLIFNPLCNMVTMVQGLTLGRIDVTINLKRRDEMGRMAAELNQYVQRLQQKVGVAQAIAQGDLTEDIEVTSNQDILGKSIQAMSKSLNTMIGQVATTAENLAQSSSKMASQMQQMDSSARQITHNATATAASVEEISANIFAINSSTTEISQLGQELKQGVTEVKQSAEDIRNQAEAVTQTSQRALLVSKEANQTLQELQAANAEIVEVVAMIRSISQQTHLLALNASIEAAGAGEAGKGFNVVAKEVKELAEQTRQATQDIESRIHGVQAVSNKVTENIARFGEVLNLIAQSTQQIHTNAEKQVVITHEASHAIGETTTGLHHIAEMVEGLVSHSSDISKLTHQFAAEAKAMNQALQSTQEASSAVLKGAEKLNSMVDWFELKK